MKRIICSVLIICLLLVGLAGCQNKTTNVKFVDYEFPSSIPFNLSSCVPGDWMIEKLGIDETTGEGLYQLYINSEGIGMFEFFKKDNESIDEIYQSVLSNEKRQEYESEFQGFANDNLLDNNVYFFEVGMSNYVIAYHVYLYDEFSGYLIQFNLWTPAISKDIAMKLANNLKVD